jgi:hypothetical protein
VFHVSTKCEPEYYEKLYAALGDRENCFFSKRVNVIWGEFSLVQAALNAIDTLIEKNVNFDFAFLLSGQDYPIKSQNQIVHILSENREKQYMEFIPFSELNDLSHWIETYHFWAGKHRFQYPHQKTGNAISAIYNLFFSLFLPKNRKFPQGLTPYKGSTWWTLTRDCVEFLHQHNHSPNGKKILNFFKNTFHPAESYIQTILMNSKYRDCIVNNDLRFILWPQIDDGHPKILTITDFNDMVSSDRLFARKFNSQIDSKVLDLLDERAAT